MHPWTRRAQANCYVVPRKLSEESYLRMCDQLQAIASGLVFDLLSKSQVGVSLTPGLGISSQPSNIELLILERVWDSLSSALHAINELPVLRLSSELRTQRCWGTERLALNSFNGTIPAPRHQGQVTLPFVAVACRPIETNDSREHRIVVWVLLFLESRVHVCFANATSQIAAIEGDRRWRDQPGKGPSLYRTIDVPRILKLREACTRAEKLHGRIQLARRLPFLRGLRPQFGFPRSPVFDNVTPYYRFARTTMDYFRSSFYVVEEGAGERLKPTHRMYEQWVFVQLAASLKASGLVCETSTEFLRPLPERRFTVDFDRDTRLTFRDADGRTVTIRYEPWVYPRTEAEQRGDSLYRDGDGRPLSPDIVVEFRSVAQTLQDVLILDAKYAAWITDDHWRKVDRYWLIRSVMNSDCSVRRLWLVYPGDGNTRAPISNLESAQGALLLRPVPNNQEANDSPEPAARDFINTALKLAGFNVGATTT